MHFKICHRVPEGKIKPISAFGDHDLHVKVAGGHVGYDSEKKYIKASPFKLCYVVPEG